MSGLYENLWKVYEGEQETLRIDKKGWLEDELFKGDWWILVGFLIVPWIIWIKLVDNRRITEILLFGLIVIVITTFLDIAGTKLSFWVYPTQLVPGLPRAFAFDVSMVPVAFMLLFQYFNTWKSYSIALVLMAATFAFVGEPFAIWIELVVYMKWKYIYSFVIYILIGMCVRALLVKFRSLTSVE